MKLPNATSLIILALLAAILTAVATNLPAGAGGVYAPLIAAVLMAVAKVVQVIYDERKASDPNARAMSTDKPSKLRQFFIG